MILLIVVAMLMLAGSGAVGFAALASAAASETPSQEKYMLHSILFLILSIVLAAGCGWVGSNIYFKSQAPEQKCVEIVEV